MSRISDFFNELYGEPHIEREFIEGGLECATRTVHLGHRCGYVAIGRDHPMYGMNDEELDDHVDVDGGVTFAKGNGDIWAIGWDAAHCWHIPDPALVGHPVDRLAYDAMPWECYMVDADMAENETRSLATQLREIGDNR